MCLPALDAMPQNKLISRPPQSKLRQPILAKDSKLVRELSLLDSILLLASGIIGSGIFLTAKEIAGNTRSPLLFLSIWAIGGVITMLACFAFAEMGAMFPEAGGQYVYLREAYGEFVAFLYGWMIFTVSVGGTIAALGAGFALYIGKVFPVLEASQAVWTVGQFKLIWTMGPFTLTRGHLVAVAAIAVQLNRIAGAFAGSTAVFAILLRRASARRVLAFFFVSHFSSAPL